MLCFKLVYKNINTLDMISSALLPKLGELHISRLYIFQYLRKKLHIEQELGLKKSFKLVKLVKPSGTSITVLKFQTLPEVKPAEFSRFSPQKLSFPFLVNFQQHWKAASVWRSGVAAPPCGQREEVQVRPFRFSFSEQSCSQVSANCLKLNRKFRYLQNQRV